MARPLVGVAGDEMLVPKPWGEQRRATAPPDSAMPSTTTMGAVVVLPPASGPEHLAHLDALVLTGGVDLGDDPRRDRDELALVRLARGLGLPLLGLCRGLQVMAVADGGTLVPDLGVSHLVLPPGQGTHPLRCTPGSVVAGLVPQGRVGSLHHQAVATYADGWRCTATAPDGVVEALEWHDQDAWTALGVQWHPELDHTGSAVFGWLVDVARRPRSRQALPRTDVSDLAAS